MMFLSKKKANATFIKLTKSLKTAWDVIGDLANQGFAREARLQELEVKIAHQNDRLHELTLLIEETSRYSHEPETITPDMARPGLPHGLK